MKVLLILIFFSSVFMPVAVEKTRLSKKHPFGMKMLCSFMFLLTGTASVFTRDDITKYSLLILTALIFGVLGDFFLSYKNERYLIAGVLFFAAGHLVYSYTFLLVEKTAELYVIIPILILTLAFAIILYFFTKAKLDLKNLQIPLIIYSGILFFSFSSAVVRGVSAISEGKIVFGLSLVLGAVLFIFSDILLGISMGGMKMPKLLKHGVSYSYFPAQTFFAISIFLQG